MELRGFLGPECLHLIFFQKAACFIDKVHSSLFLGMLLKFFLTLSLEKGVLEVLLSFFDFPEFLQLVYGIRGKSIVKLLLFIPRLLLRLYPNSVVSKLVNKFNRFHEAHKINQEKIL